MILCPGQEGKIYLGFSTIVPKTFQVTYVTYGLAIAGLFAVCPLQILEPIIQIL